MNETFTSIAIFFAGVLVGMLTMVAIEFLLYKLVRALGNMEVKATEKGTVKTLKSS